MDCVVRQIDPSEAALILPLLDQVQAIHAAVHPDIYKAETDGAELLAMLRELLEKDGVTALVALAADGSAVGYALCEIESREPTPLMHGRRLGVLHQISVDRDWRHRGVGLALVEAVKVRLRAEGVPHLRAIHGAFNETSAGLLRKAGLRPLNIVSEGEV